MRRKNKLSFPFSLHHPCISGGLALRLDLNGQWWSHLEVVLLDLFVIPGHDHFSVSHGLSHLPLSSEFVDKLVCSHVHRTLHCLHRHHFTDGSLISHRQKFQIDLCSERWHLKNIQAIFIHVHYREMTEKKDWKSKKKTVLEAFQFADTLSILLVFLFN